MVDDLRLSLGTVSSPSFPRLGKQHWSDGMARSTVEGTKSTMKSIDVNKLPTEDWDVAAEEEEATISSPISAVSSVSAGKRPQREETGENDRGDCSGGGPTATSTSDDEDGGDGSKKKLRLSKEQSSVLEESFKEHSTLNPNQKLALSSVVHLTPRQVEVWFQNRRARTKLKQTEVNCEYLKRCCEKLTEENRRLQKELQELRAFKLSPSFFTQMTPPTTLTICPICEHDAGTTNPPQAAAFGGRNSGNGIDWRCPPPPPPPPQQQPHAFFPHRPTPMLPWPPMLPRSQR